MFVVIRRHPLASYFIIACAISWLAVAPLIAAGLSMFDLGLSPSWHALGALGPVTAAVVVTGVIGGRAGLAEFWGRLVRWRAGVVWWLLALSPVALCALALGALRIAGAPLAGAGALRHAFADPAWIGGMFLASLAYGLGEEPGWRGFALPRLQYGRTALRATLLLGVGWGLWHVPYFFYRYHLHGVGEYVGFYLGLLAGALWLTFLYNSSGGSTLIVVVWHLVWNAVALAAAVVSPALVAVTSALIMVSGVVALLVGGARHLSWTESHIVPSPTPA
ncbi:MAG TPA: CPBP family glutamic-type intramembrane protease [Gemmatimonadales bacterium]|nr:CPBP family glutamic-type intramembrane protease [Gemmatimonadales bacterium]